MTLDLISSEDSGSNNGEEVLIVRPLPCRSDRVDHMISDQDRQRLSDKSPLAKRQMKCRVLGHHSQRPKSSGVPQWALSNSA